MALQHAFGVGTAPAAAALAHAYVYADATERQAASGFTDSDLGKQALQLDEYSVWVLVSTAPTWKEVSAFSIGILEGEDLASRTLRTYDTDEDGFTRRSSVFTNSAGAVLDYAQGPGDGTVSGVRQLSVSVLGATYSDTIGSGGIAYAADYSANFTDRTLVDKAYVDSAIASGSVDLSPYLTIATAAAEYQPIGPYLTPASLTGYATEFWVSDQLIPYATEAYVDAAIPSLAGLATESYADSRWPFVSEALVQGVDTILTGTGFNILDIVLYDTNGGAADYQNRFRFYMSPTVFELSLAGGNGSGLVQDYTGFSVSSRIWRFFDDDNGFGIQYDDDYSSTFIARSLIDKAYADAGNFFKTSGGIEASRTYNAENSRAFTFQAFNTTESNWSVRGLIQLGHFNVQLARAVGSNGVFSSHQSINLTASGMQVFDSQNNRGLVYDADYSANYTDRSLVDKAYVDGASILTFSATKNNNQDLPASTAWTDITSWDAPTYSETGDFNSGTGVWTCTEAGKYRVHFNATLDQFIGNNRTNSYMRMILNGSLIKGMDQTGYHRQNAHGFNNYAATRTIPLVPGDVIRVQARNTNSALRQRVLANNIVFEIEKIG